MHNVLVGSVSFASPGAKALHNASTAQEITVITESASNFQFKVRKSPLTRTYIDDYIRLFFSTSDGAIRPLCQKVLFYLVWPSRRRHRHRRPRPGVTQVRGVLKAQGEGCLLKNAVPACLPNPKEDNFKPKLPFLPAKASSPSTISPTNPSVRPLSLIDSA